MAEVLITFGIIGVVAALTMPRLVAKYQKKVLETRLLKFRIDLATLGHRSPDFLNFCYAFHLSEEMYNSLRETMAQNDRVNFGLCLIKHDGWKINY